MPIYIWCRVAAMINQLPIPSKSVTMGPRHTEISISLAMVTVSNVGMSFVWLSMRLRVFSLDYKLALKEFIMVHAIITWFKISLHEVFAVTQVAGQIPIPPRYAFGVFYSRYWAYDDTGEMVRLYPLTHIQLLIDCVFRILCEAIRNAIFHWMYWSLTWTGTSHSIVRDKKIRCHSLG